MRHEPLDSRPCAPKTEQVRFTNHQLAARLRQIAHDRAAKDLGYYRIRAFSQAAHIVARLPDSLEHEIRAGIDATRPPCIGPRIARILRVMVRGEDFGPLEFPLVCGPPALEPEAA